MGVHGRGELPSTCPPFRGPHPPWRASWSRGGSTSAKGPGLAQHHREGKTALWTSEPECQSICGERPLARVRWACFTTLLLQGVLGRLVTLPTAAGARSFAVSGASPSWHWVVMSAAVAGVVEETAFLGVHPGRHRAAPRIGDGDSRHRWPIRSDPLHTPGGWPRAPTVLPRGCDGLRPLGGCDELDVSEHGPARMGQRVLGVQPLHSRTIGVAVDGHSTADDLADRSRRSILRRTWRCWRLPALATVLAYRGLFNASVISTLDPQ